MRITAPARLSHNGAEAVVTSVPSILRNLLQTSRQIRNEFLATFWKSAIFELSVVFFGLKITRLGSCLLGNLRHVVIHGSIGGEMALRDLTSNICMLKYLPRLQSVELGLRKHSAISQSLGSKAEKEDIDSVRCNIHAPLIEDCEILSFLRERFETLEDTEDAIEENSRERFNFRFWMQPLPAETETFDYAPRQLRRCVHLSCRIAFSLAKFFGPQYPCEKRSVWPLLARRKFYDRIVDEIDVSDLPRTVVVNDNEPKDTSLFKLLVTPPCDSLEYPEETDEEDDIQ